MSLRTPRTGYASTEAATTTGTYGVRDELPTRSRASRWQTTAAAFAALILALSVGLTACGTQSPQRSDFDTILAPERCGGVKDACG